MSKTITVGQLVKVFDLLGIPQSHKESLIKTFYRSYLSLVGLAIISKISSEKKEEFIKKTDELKTVPDTQKRLLTLEQWLTENIASEERERIKTQAIDELYSCFMANLLQYASPNQREKVKNFFQTSAI